METLKQRYKKLEDDVIAYLIHKVVNSKIESKQVNTKAIKVNVFDYTELIYLNGELMFLDTNGLLYSIYSECSLEDLIEICEELRNG
jgi:predicted ribosome-associated RNA-binding protein Tma20